LYQAIVNNSEIGISSMDLFFVKFMKKVTILIDIRIYL
jgi:hypothetical protein